MPHFTGIEFLIIIEKFVYNLKSVIITAEPLNVKVPSSKEYRILDKNYNLGKELRQIVSQMAVTAC